MRNAQKFSLKHKEKDTTLNTRKNAIKMDIKIEFDVVVLSHLLQSRVEDSCGHGEKKIVLHNKNWGTFYPDEYIVPSQEGLCSKLLVIKISCLSNILKVRSYVLKTHQNSITKINRLLIFKKKIICFCKLEEQILSDNHLFIYL